jgi:hypothetical protein
MRIQEVQTAIQRAEQLIHDRMVLQSQLEIRLAHARRLLVAAAQHHAQGQHEAAVAKARIAVRSLREPGPAIGGAKEVEEGQ